MPQKNIAKIVKIDKNYLPEILEIWENTKLKIDLKNQKINYNLKIYIHSGILALQEKYQDNIGSCTLEICLIGDNSELLEDCKIAQSKNSFIWKSSILVTGLNCSISQYNKNFIVNNLGKISAIPSLKIYTPIVKFAKHGSNSVFLDDEQIWYLQNRGISNPQKLLIQDFFKN